MTYYYTTQNFYSLNLTNVEIYSSEDTQAVELLELPIATTEDIKEEIKNPNTIKGFVNRVFSKVRGEDNIELNHKIALDKQFAKELITVERKANRIKSFEIDGCDLSEKVIKQTILNEMSYSADTKLVKINNA